MDFIFNLNNRAIMRNMIENDYTGREDFITLNKLIEKCKSNGIYWKYANNFSWWLTFAMKKKGISSKQLAARTQVMEVNLDYRTVDNYCNEQYGIAMPCDIKIKIFNKIVMALNEDSTFVSSFKPSDNREMNMFWLKSFQLACEDEVEDEEQFSIQEKFNKEDLAEKIKKYFYKLKILECYKLYKHIDEYLAIDKHAWVLLCRFSILNSQGKDLLKECLYQIQTSIKEQLHLWDTPQMYDYVQMKRENINKVEKAQIFKDMEDKINVKNGSLLPDAMRKFMWEEISKKLAELEINDIEWFKEWMAEYSTMESEDWDIILAYMLYPNKKIIEAIADSLTCNEKYVSKKDNDDLQKRLDFQLYPC